MCYSLQPHGHGFPSQANWSGLPFPSPGALGHPGIKPGSPAFQAESLPSEPPGKPSESLECTIFKEFLQPNSNGQKIWMDISHKKI